MGERERDRYIGKFLKRKNARSWDYMAGRAVLGIHEKSDLSVHS